MRQNIEPTKVPLLNDLLLPDEAIDVLRETIDSQIKYYQVQKLRLWMNDYKTDQKIYDKKIADLQSKKASLLSLVNEANYQKDQVSIEIDYKLKIVK